VGAAETFTLLNLPLLGIKTGPLRWPRAGDVRRWRADPGAPVGFR
jgi:hypothetical protein